MTKERIVGLMKNISFFVGGIAIMVTGLIYVLVTDLYLGNTSNYLLLGIILAFSGSICFILSNSFKHKIKVFYILRGIGIVMSIGFIIYLFAYTNAELYSKATYFKLFKKYDGKTIWFLSSNFKKGMQIAMSIKPIYITNIVLAIVGVVCQGANILLNAINGVED